MLRPQTLRTAGRLYALDAAVGGRTLHTSPSLAMSSIINLPDYGDEFARLESGKYDRTVDRPLSDFFPRKSFNAVINGEENVRGIMNVVLKGQDNTEPAVIAGVELLRDVYRDLSRVGLSESGFSTGSRHCSPKHKHKHKNHDSTSSSSSSSESESESDNSTYKYSMEDWALLLESSAPDGAGDLLRKLTESNLKFTPVANATADTVLLVSKPIKAPKPSKKKYDRSKRQWRDDADDREDTYICLRAAPVSPRTVAITQTFQALEDCYMAADPNIARVENATIAKRTLFELADRSESETPVYMLQSDSPIGLLGYKEGTDGVARYYSSSPTTVPTVKQLLPPRAHYQKHAPLCQFETRVDVGELIKMVTKDQGFMARVTSQAAYGSSGLGSHAEVIIDDEGDTTHKLIQAIKKFESVAEDVARNGSIPHDIALLLPPITLRWHVTAKRTRKVANWILNNIEKSKNKQVDVKKEILGDDELFKFRSNGLSMYMAFTNNELIVTNRKYIVLSYLQNPNTIGSEQPASTTSFEDVSRLPEGNAAAKFYVDSRLMTLAFTSSMEGQASALVLNELGLLIPSVEASFNLDKGEIRANGLFKPTPQIKN